MKFSGIVSRTKETVLNSELAFRCLLMKKDYPPPAPPQLSVTQVGEWR